MVTPDGATEERTLDTFMLAICNGQYFGSGMHVAPMADLSDGTFDIVTFNATTKVAFAAHSRGVYGGTHVKDGHASHFKAQKLTVELVNGSGSTACASRTAISPAVSQTLTFAQSAQATEQGRKSIALTVNRAYPDVRCRVKTQDEATRVIGRFLIYYRDNAKWLERTYDFAPRIGLENLKDILVNDSLGIGTELDTEVEKTAAAYVDPWLERDKPVFAGQFESERRVPLPVLA